MDNNAYTMEIPKNSRLAKYVEEYPKISREDTSAQADFIYKIHEECKTFLEKTFLFTFPKIILKFIDQKEYDQWRKWYEYTTREKLNEYAFCDCRHYP